MGRLRRGLIGFGVMLLLLSGLSVGASAQGVTLSASRCIPRADEPSLCTSTISWSGAPADSCVLVSSKEPGARRENPFRAFACAGSGSSEANWIPSTRPTTIRFWLISQSQTYRTLAETLVWENTDRMLPRIAATPCVPNQSGRELCTSVISWSGAPPDACVFVATTAESGREGPHQIFGCAERWQRGIAPWLRTANPAAARFWLAPRSRPWVELAEVRPTILAEGSSRSSVNLPAAQLEVSTCLATEVSGRCSASISISNAPKDASLLVGAEDECKNRKFVQDPKDDVCIRLGYSFERDSSGLFSVDWMPSDRLTREKWKFFLVQGPENDRKLLAESAVPAVVAPAAVNQRNLPDDTFSQKLFTGYQAWFNTPGDGAGKGWSHWGSLPAATSPTNARDFGDVRVEALPDVSEYPASALTDSKLYRPSSGFVPLFSSLKRETIDLHLKWMKAYGIDGLFLQWFLTDNPAVRHEITRRVRESAEKHGRQFSVMFDITGAIRHPKFGQKLEKWNVVGKREIEKISDEIKLRWRRLVDEGITQSPSYTRFKGKPLVSIWGFGFKHNFQGTWCGGGLNITQCSDLYAGHVESLIDWFQNNPDVRYRAAVLGGVPRDWRNGKFPSGQSMGGDWTSKVYSKLDIVSPWTVGVFRDSLGLSNYVRDYVVADRALTVSRGQTYFPVISPGFSWTNLKRGVLGEELANVFNPIPRKGGQWMWEQAKQLLAPKGSSGYIAMFDEVDEGTAIFKISGKRNEPMLVEDNGGLRSADPWKFLTPDTDGFYGLPSDWYLRVASHIGWWLRSRDGLEGAPAQMPILPAQPYRDPSLR